MYIKFINVIVIYKSKDFLNEVFHINLLYLFLFPRDMEIFRSIVTCNHAFWIDELCKCSDQNRFLENRGKRSHTGYLVRQRNNTELIFHK